MSVGEAPKIGSDEYAWAGLSTDTKPPNAFVGQIAIETDTGNNYEWTGSSWQQTTIAGAKNVGGIIDFVADFEVDGIEMSVAFGDTSSSGDTTALAVGANDRVKVYGVAISPDATLTGDVHAEIGSTQITPKMRNAIVGGTHWILPVNGNFIHGALGEDVLVSNTVAEAISYAVYYEVYTP